jgi:hypothetical protein
MTSSERAGSNAVRGERVVSVTLTFDAYESDLARLGGDDFAFGRKSGITVESCAASLLRGHPAELGYIEWKASR